MDTWSQWYNFYQIYEYHDLVNKNFISERKEKVNWRGQYGRILTDNGFFLRSKTYTKGSFKNYYPKISINEKSCILKKDSPGVYCLRIDAENNKKFNYIGISGVSIHDRLLHHFIKIAGTTEYAGGRHSSDTKEFKLMREYFNSKKIDTSNPNFFNSLQLSFFIFKKSTKLEAKLLKIEGMGIQSFKNKHGHIPELNSRDETFGIEHFPIND